MRVKVPDYYKEFKCIAGDCKDSCCAGWEVDVDERAQEYYVTVSGAFGKRLKDSTIIDEDGIRFTLTPNKRCCFLNDCNLCDLYTALGEEHLCDTCAEFPRFYECFGDLKEKGISLSCPTAADLILRYTEPLTWEEQEEDDEISLNEIDYDLYMQLTAAREQCFSMLQDRTHDIIWRMIVVLLFSNDIQKYIYKGKYKKIEKVRMKYGDSDFLEKQVRKWIKKAAKHVDGVENRTELLNIYTEFEVVNAEWVDILAKAVSDNECMDEELAAKFAAYLKNRQIAYEQIMVYFIYRYFMKAVYDYDLISKVKFGVVSTLVIRCVDYSQWLSKQELPFEDFVWLAHLYSKEIEHSDENMDALAAYCDGDMRFHVEALIASLL